MDNQPAKSSQIPVVRCAIYTRKSTEENLNLDFNSLDAQRESAEAYIASQKHAGWLAIPDHYDDGGFSGGTIDRPAFQKLMDDVEAGRVNCIVVYKIDRLSRSLMDFAKIMEVLDRRNVSLVSVTQQFNTTSSMGRLTLNILLSFAQFEREIISERTRDKIAAARRKGKWTGGPPVLGYDRVRDNHGTRLVLNEAEAEHVRAIFEQYMKVGSLMRVSNWLNELGWMNKAFTTAGGKPRGGKDFDKSTLQKMLTNVLYIGKITYGSEIYPGEHPAIVDEDLFGRVQGMLARNRNHGGTYQRNKYGALLKGLVRCKHCGCAMVHHYASRARKRYRYYVCMNAHKKGWATCPYPSLPAGELEQYVIGQIKETCSDPALLTDVVDQAVMQLHRQIQDMKETRAVQTNRVKRINDDLCKLARTPQTPRTKSEMFALQEELQKAESGLEDTNREIVAMEQRAISRDELTGAFESFDPMWDQMRLDERARLIHLLVQSVEYDGKAGEISIVYHPGGLAAIQNREIAAHDA